MSEIETISWRELTGNKFVRGLDPAMLTEQGLIKQTAIRRIGEVKRTMFNVIYDREYLIRAIGRYICRQMFCIGKEETLKLVSEAWDTFYPNYPSRPQETIEVINVKYPKV